LVPAKSDEVEIAVASAGEPVMLPKMEFAATCARLENGRSPVTSAVRSTVAQDATPAPLRDRTNWLVHVEPWYSESDPSAPARGRAEVILVMARLEVVAPEVVSEVMTPLVAESAEAKREVEVAFVVVALRAKKSWKVDEAVTKRLPKNPVPDAEIAVDDAYGNTDAVVEVAVKDGAVVSP
jgi:hypothetical protein